MEETHDLSYGAFLLFQCAFEETIGNCDNCGVFWTKAQLELVPDVIVEDVITDEGTEVARHITLLRCCPSCEDAAHERMALEEEHN